MKWLLRLVIVTFFLSSVGTTLLHIPAHAVTGSDWKAGRIIDDSVFTDVSSMSVTDVQNFLNAQVPNCDTNGTQPATEYGRSDITHAQYAASRGWPAPPYVCLRNYYEVPKTSPAAGMPDNSYNHGGGAFTGGVSAAQLIYNAAQQYKINPKVLLVMIQKESAGPLTTDNWPLQSQYQYPLGAHCPDTPAGCDANYMGFSIQISESAALLRWYLDSMSQSWWQYKKPGNNSILYNPSSSCGASNVNITTSATAALYTYTPYQPNAAALANLYGTGDSCSAYGNRNFWRIYSDWFGSTFAPSFQANLYSQSAFPSIRQGQAVNVRMSYVNQGSVLWTDDSSAASLGQYPIHLATAGPTNRISNFSATWPSGGRPRLTFSKVYNADGVTLSSNQHVVNPGQIAEFDFTLTASTDLKPGTYQEAFFPVREGTSSWYIGGYSWLNVNVLKGDFTAQFTGQSAYPTMAAGDVTTAYFDIKNNGNVDWHDEASKQPGIAPVRLATFMALNRSSGFSAGWTSPSRPTLTFSKVFLADGITPSTNQHLVQPGQIARFTITLTAKSDISRGLYREYFIPILEGASNWKIGNPMWQDVSVSSSTYSAAYVSQSPYPTLAKGTSSSAVFKLKNNGGTIWYDTTSAPNGISPVHLATTNPINRASMFGPTWTSTSRPVINFAKVYESNGITLAANQHVVNPGQIAEFDFTLSVPANTNPGSYREYFSPIVEGSAHWNMGLTLWLDIAVQ